MATLRVLVANQPATYRQSHAEVLRQMRPNLEVRLAEPSTLDADIARFVPHLVLCSALTDSVRAVPAWLLLYPGGANLAVACAAGRQRTIPDVGIEDMLAVIDEAAQRIGSAGNDSNAPRDSGIAIPGARQQRRRFGPAGRRGVRPTRCASTRSTASTSSRSRRSSPA